MLNSNSEASKSFDGEVGATLLRGTTRRGDPISIWLRFDIDSIVNYSAEPRGRIVNGVVSIVFGTGDCQEFNRHAMISATYSVAFYVEEVREFRKSLRDPGSRGNHVSKLECQNGVLRLYIDARACGYLALAVVNDVGYFQSNGFSAGDPKCDGCCVEMKFHLDIQCLGAAVTSLGQLLSFVDYA